MEGSFFNALGSVQRFATKISWNTNYQYHFDKLQLCTVNMRSCATYINWFMVCPFFLTLVTPLPPCLTPLTLTIIFLYMYLPPTQMLIITPLFVKPYVSGTHYSLKRTVCNYLQLLLCLYCIVPYSWVHTRTY